MTIENHESTGIDEQQSSRPAGHGVPRMARKKNKPTPDITPVIGGTGVGTGVEKSLKGGVDPAVGREFQFQPGTQKHQMRGRKPAYESRAVEFRRELITWKQIPESMRPSLRALASKLGTTHQLLSHYLDGLDTWQAKENAKRIRARAKAEGRPMTLRESLDAIITPGWLGQIEKLRKAARRGPLNRYQVQMLKLFAKPGLPGTHEAQAILAKCRQMTPEEERQARASEQAAHFAQTIERIRRDGERGPLCWQDIERLKYFARRKCAGAKELLQKYSKSALPRPQVPQ